MLNNKDKMDPQDMRNLIIFGIVSIALWSLYELYVLQPQREAIEKRAHIERVIAQKEAETGVEIVQKPIVRPREEVLGQGRDSRIKIDNGTVFGSMSLLGGRLDDIALHHHYDTLAAKNNVVVLSPRDTEHPRFFEHGWVAKEPGVALPNAQTLWSVRGNRKLGPDSPVTLFWDNGQGLRFERVYSIDDNYLVTLEQRVVNNTGREISLFPYGLITQTGLPPGLQNMWIMHEGPIGFVGDELIQITYENLRQEQKRDASAAQGWIGFSDKYWLTSVMPPQDRKSQFRFRHTPNIKDREKGRFQVDYTASVVNIPAGETGATTSHLFVGAKEVLVLEEYEKQLNLPNFDLAVDFGWFWFMTKPFFYILHYLNEFIGNMGIAIICLTLIIRMATFPLTNTSYRSFAKMKKVNPHIVELREKYGDDKVRLQQEIVELYTREGVNPMSGCLPILIQIPIFFSLYKVFFVTIEMRHAPFFGWIQDLSAPDPTSLFNLFGLIPWDPPSLLMIGVWPCLMFVIMMIQKKLNPPPQDNIQRGMMNAFPFLIAFFMAGFASGLVIYWTFSGLISMMQQMYIMRKLNVPIYLFGEEDHDDEVIEAVKKGPGVHPLSEMAEEDMEEAMFDHEKDEPKQVSPPKPKKSKKKKK